MGGLRHLERISDLFLDLFASSPSQKMAFIYKNKHFLPIPYRSAMRLFRIGQFQLCYFFAVEDSPPYLLCLSH